MLTLSCLTLCNTNLNLLMQPKDIIIDLKLAISAIVGPNATKLI